MMHSRKIQKIMDHALKMRNAPHPGLTIPEGPEFRRELILLPVMVRSFPEYNIQRVYSQLSVILGPCAGGAVYSPALTDFVFVVDNISKMFITGPEVIKTVLGEEISMEDLGGARVHSEITGNAHFFA